MTTDRYDLALARIEDEIAKIDFFRDVMRTEPGSKDREDLWRLRKAVLELHFPDEDGNCNHCTPWRRFDGIVQFPCPTAEKIIEGVLGNGS